MTPTAWHIRPVASTDQAWIVQLYHDVWHETHASRMTPEAAHLRPLAYFADRFRSFEQACLVAIGAEGEGVGFVGWEGNRIGQLYLAPQVRGSGLAAALLNDALREIARSGYRTAILDCLAANDRGLRFYEREGWRRLELHDFPVVDGSALTAPFWRLERALHEDMATSE